jgi:curved DNA-binding protein CbpA
MPSTRDQKPRVRRRRRRTKPVVPPTPLSIASTSRNSGSLYDVLHLPPTASQAQVDAAFARAQHAHAVLGDECRRAAYDAARPGVGDAKGGKQRRTQDVVRAQAKAVGERVGEKPSARQVLKGVKMGTKAAKMGLDAFGG